MTFSSGQCLVPQVVGSCTDGATTKEFGDLSEGAQFDAYAVVQALRCSTMGRPMLSTYASESLDVTREYAVAQELLTGTASGNPSLADAEILAGGNPDLVTALACLDQYAARLLSGRLAFIHASPALGTLLMAASAIRLEGRRWLTALGNVVIISPGYDGREPGQGRPGEGDPLYLYATGEVSAEVGQRENLEAVERGQNSSNAIAEDAAIAVFDPCFNVAVSTDVDFCDLAPIS